MQENCKITEKTRKVINNRSWPEVLFVTLQKLPGNKGCTVSFLVMGLTGYFLPAFSISRLYK